MKRIKLTEIQTVLLLVSISGVMSGLAIYIEPRFYAGIMFGLFYGFVRFRKLSYILAFTIVSTFAYRVAFSIATSSLFYPGSDLGVLSMHVSIEVMGVIKVMSYAIAGAFGAFCLAIINAILSKNTRDYMRIIRTIIIGWVTGLLFYFSSLLLTIGIITAYVLWQVAVAWSLVYRNKIIERKIL